MPKIRLKNIDRLALLPAHDAADIIRNEHPQVIAVILYLLGKKLAATVMTHFTDRLRNDVALRSLTLDSIDNKWLKDLNKGLGRSIKLFGKKTYTDIGPRGGMITLLPPSMKASVMDNIAEYDPELAELFRKGKV